MTTTVPATDDEDIYAVFPMYGADGVTGFSCEPMIGWRVDGDPDSGRLIPVMEDGEDEFGPDEIYALLYPDGTCRFPDGERCSKDALMKVFRKRCAAR